MTLYSLTIAVHVLKVIRLSSNSGSTIIIIIIIINSHVLKHEIIIIHNIIANGHSTVF